MFEVTKSKLYAPIMEALARFMGKNPSESTETELHDALEGQKPLAEQLEEARNAAESKNGTDITDMKARLESLETAQTKMEGEMSVKDERIAELQTQIAASEEAATKTAATIEILKAQHDKEIKVLAGQVSSLKAGRVLEQDEQGDKHSADEETKGGEGVFKIQSSKLQESLKKRKKA